MKRSRWLSAAAVRVMTACQNNGQLLRLADTSRAGGRAGKPIYLVVRGLWLWDGDLLERVVDLVRLARNLLDDNGRRHGGWAGRGRGDATQDHAA